MIFFMHTALALELIALVFGIGLLLFLSDNKKFQNKWVVFAGWFVVVVASLMILCTIYYRYQFWNMGFEKNMFQTHQMMQKNMPYKK